jgi:hypothetical protein
MVCTLFWVTYGVWLGCDKAMRGDRSDGHSGDTRGDNLKCTVWALKHLCVNLIYCLFLPILPKKKKKESAAAHWCFKV